MDAASEDAGVNLSVVSPCYNEEESLQEFFRRVVSVCTDSVGENYEIVLVDDGSKDRTWSIISSYSISNPRVVGVRLSRNHGHQLALSAGLMYCRGDRILILDADLQDPPELLPEMMAEMDSGVDVVYGQRLHRAGETWFKKVTASGFYRLLDSLVDIEIPVDTGDFRLMSRRALEALNAMPENHRFIRGMVSWVGFRQQAIRYERAPRFAGETKYPLSKMVRFAVDAVSGFSIRPLRLASYLGFLSGLAAVLLLVYVFGSWATGGAVPGWTSLMVVVLVLGSGQLLVAGVMGRVPGASLPRVQAPSAVRRAGHRSRTGSPSRFITCGERRRQRARFCLTAFLKRWCGRGSSPPLVC